MTGDLAGGRRPVVSIGLPVYNGARFLRELIPSLINQTFRDFELIVADNASTDATQEICRSFAQSDSRIRYSRSDRNRGLAWNHNHIVELARGEFFKWVGHDDVYEPRFIERCVDVFRSDSPAVVLVYPRSRIIDESGSVLWEHCDGLDLQERTSHERLKRLVWNPPTMGTSIYGLIRTTALRQTQLLQPFASHDYVLLAELALLGEFREIPEFLLLKRYHPGMSREAPSDVAGVAENLQPGGSNHILLEYWTLFGRHLVAINRSPISVFERLRCHAAFGPSWIRVWGPRLRKELGRLPAELKRVRTVRKNRL